MPTRRGLPLAVGVVIVVAVGLLVARPWGGEPTPSPTLRLPVSAVTAAPSSDAAPTALPSPQPTPTLPPLVLPTPDLAPPGPIGTVALETTPDSALVRCDYARARGGRPRLAGVEVMPPVADLGPQADESDIKRITWHFEVETNTHDHVFDRDWQVVARSAGQSVRAVVGRTTQFKPMSARVHGPIVPTAVFRVRVIVEWLTRNVELAGRAELVANRYQQGNDQLIGSWPPYCEGVRPAR